MEGNCESNGRIPDVDAIEEALVSIGAVPINVDAIPENPSVIGPSENPETSQQESSARRSRRKKKLAVATSSGEKPPLPPIQPIRKRRKGPQFLPENSASSKMVGVSQPKGSIKVDDEVQVMTSQDLQGILSKIPIPTSARKSPRYSKPHLNPAINAETPRSRMDYFRAVMCQITATQALIVKRQEEIAKSVAELNASTNSITMSIRTVTELMGRELDALSNSPNVTEDACDGE